jgi:hypothetical protein
MHASDRVADLAREDASVIASIDVVVSESKPFGEVLCGSHHH